MPSFVQLISFLIFEAPSHFIGIIAFIVTAALQYL